MFVQAELARDEGRDLDFDRVRDRLFDFLLVFVNDLPLFVLVFNVFRTGLLVFTGVEFLFGLTDLDFDFDDLL